MEPYFLNNEIAIYDIDFDYRMYLRKFDERVNTKDERRFIGVIIILNEHDYFIPLTSKPLRVNGKRRKIVRMEEIISFKISGFRVY